MKGLGTKSLENHAQCIKDGDPCWYDDECCSEHCKREEKNIIQYRKECGPLCKCYTPW